SRQPARTGPQDRRTPLQHGARHTRALRARVSRKRRVARGYILTDCYSGCYGHDRAAFRMYDLPHTRATMALLDGVNPKVVSERLWHSTITLTMDTYSHVLPTMQEDVASKFEAMFG